jgi:hypothetical protein
MSDRPELGSIFAFLFGAEQSQDALKEYQAALGKAQQDLKEAATAEETIQVYGRCYGATSWHSAKETN